jgi:biotin carboxyl carrier protein
MRRVVGLRSSAKRASGPMAESRRSEDLRTQMNEPTTSDSASIAAKPRMPLRARLLIFFTAWAILALPFLFWRSSWFGRPLSDTEINEYLHDDAKPRHIQHALVQIGERIARGRNRGLKPAEVAAAWYPDLVRLSSYKVEEIRNTDAWLMGQDPSRPEFHDALRAMLADPSTNVRSNAALSLVSFGDAAGHDQIVAMLQPTSVTAPAAGQIAQAAKAGDPIRTGTMLARIEDAAGNSTDVRSPITGTVKSIAVKAGQQIAQGVAVAVVDPGTEQAWEGLRALFFIGTADDLPLVKSFESRGSDLGDKVRQQAVETEKEILRRGK